jgi:hypothetical protein
MPDLWAPGEVAEEAAVADILARLTAGQLPVFTIPRYPAAPLAALPAFVALGVLAGLFGVGFNRCLLGALDLFARFTGRSMLIAAATVGAAAGLVGWFSPNLIGGGHGLSVLPAIVRAPLTGIVLIVEMTGNYDQILALLVACFCAYAVAEGLRSLPIYEALLQRDLRLGGAGEALESPAVVDVTIAPGAPFDGRTVRDLGLPPGCIIVRVQDGGRTWVPTATTRLAAHMRLTAIIAPDAPNAVRVLRDGCGYEPLATATSDDSTPRAGLPSRRSRCAACR